MKPKLIPPGTERLKLKYDEPPSNFAFKLSLRHYISAAGRVATAERERLRLGVTQLTSMEFDDSW